MRSADLRLSVGDSPDPVASGAILTYTLTVANDGPDPLDEVRVSDPLPPGLTVISVESTHTATTSRSGCDISPAQSVRCRFGPLASGSSAEIAIEVRVGVVPQAPATSGTISNTASVAGSEDDPELTNNSATATTTVTGPPRPACSDGTDNDADGRADFPTDAGCTSGSDPTEAPDPVTPPAACGDGQDNDGDGKIDYPADPGCSSSADLDEVDPSGSSPCHASYPDFCIPPPPPDLNCGNFTQKNFRVRHDVPNPDPHRLDSEKDGVGCET